EPGVTVMTPPGPGVVLNVRRAEKAAGGRADSPYAARSRSVLILSLRCQNGSSLTTHDALTFGYVTHLSFSPNALLLSTRKPAVRTKRSCHPNCCSPYAPIVVLMLCVCEGVVAVPDVTVSTPGAGNPVAVSTLVF